MTLFLDTNILLDILDDTRPFSNESLKIFQAAEDGRLRILFSTQSVADSAYIMRNRPWDVFKKSLKVIFDVAVIVPVTDMDILHALKSDCPDFEDAVLAACAESNLASLLLTNNKKHFLGHTGLPLYTSTEFVAKMMSPKQ